MNRTYIRALTSVMLVLVLPGCSLVVSNAIKGSGTPTTITYQFSNFSKIEAHDAFQVMVTQDDNYRVAVTIDDNLTNYLNITQTGDTVHIGLKPVSVRNAHMAATVTMPALTALVLTDATHGKISGFDSDKPLAVTVRDASHLTGDIKSATAELQVSDASHLDFTGAAANLKVKASDASGVNLEKFQAKEAVVEARDASHVTVSASDLLHAKASDASSVRYIGSPADLKVEASDASSIKPK